MGTYRIKRSVVISLFALLSASPAVAEDVNSITALTLFTENQWSGSNNDGPNFTFFHEPNGRFEATFDPPINGQAKFTGSMQAKGEQLCWAWDGWKTFCYVAFDLNGDELTITREDGVVQTGTLTPR